MSYHVVDPETQEPHPDWPCLARSISGVTEERAGFERLGIRTFVAEPGEMVPRFYHYHEIQEEAFYVVSGTLHVETPDRVYEVDEGEFFLVEPGNPHRGFNPEEADAAVEVVAMGAPTDDRGHRYDPSESPEE